MIGENILRMQSKREEVFSCQEGVYVTAYTKYFYHMHNNVILLSFTHSHFFWPFMRNFFLIQFFMALNLCYVPSSSMELLSEFSDMETKKRKNSFSLTHRDTITMRQLQRTLFSFKWDFISIKVRKVNLIFFLSDLK